MVVSIFWLLKRKLIKEFKMLSSAIALTLVGIIYLTIKEKKKNKKELLVGRDTEINKITEILCRFSKQNVLIIGDHGVGKTALIEGFVQKVLLKQIPDILSGLEIYELDMGALIAGASYKG